MMWQQRNIRWEVEIPPDDFQKWSNGGEIKFDSKFLQ